MQPVRATLPQCSQCEDDSLKSSWVPLVTAGRLILCCNFFFGIIIARDYHYMWANENQWEWDFYWMIITSQAKHQVSRLGIRLKLPGLGVPVSSFSPSPPTNFYLVIAPLCVTSNCLCAASITMGGRRGKHVYVNLHNCYWCECMSSDLCQANVTFYHFDTKSQVGMTLKGTNPLSSDFRKGDKTLINKQLMP